MQLEDKEVLPAGLAAVLPAAIIGNEIGEGRQFTGLICVVCRSGCAE